jgi:hypothetical protein
MTDPHTDHGALGVLTPGTSTTSNRTPRTARAA